jgi:hypothetical protein
MEICQFFSECGVSEKIAGWPLHEDQVLELCV